MRQLVRRALKHAPLVAALVLAGVWLLLLRPVDLGGPATYTVVSGHSMDPTLHQDDLLMLRAQDDYQVGDIVTYRVPEGQPAEGLVIVHRLTGGDAERGFITQGDNNPEPDPWRPTGDDILGKLAVQIDGGGTWLQVACSPLVIGMLAAGLGAYMVLGGKPRRREQHEPDDGEPTDTERADETQRADERVSAPV